MTDLYMGLYYKCEICGKPMMDGTVKWTGSGNAHPNCYTLNNPPITARKIEELLWNCNNPMLCSDVVCEIVPAEMKAEIVRTYNRRLLLDWQKRCDKIRGEET